VRAWAWTRPLAEAWWAAATTLDGVAQLAERQAQQDRGPRVHHDPAPRLVHLLTLARLNRLPEIEPHKTALAEQLDPAEFDAAVSAIARASTGTAQRPRSFEASLRSCKTRLAWCGRQQLRWRSGSSRFV
jgi:hypothetical protein